ncbi:MAG: hypothetical protein J7647_19535 [Cyanobacteria bacterium SBLK]|nr:hypothetical protein [Cyanobacteria bacterium SBLK]
MMRSHTNRNRINWIAIALVDPVVTHPHFQTRDRISGIVCDRLLHSTKFNRTISDR